MLSPPLDMSPQWFAGHVAYTMAKYGMSLCVLGMAEEFKADGIAFNALWPRTDIATAAIRNVLGGEACVRMSRTPDIMADAAYVVFQKPARAFTGNFLIDDSFLYGEGACAILPDTAWSRAVPLAPDFFVPDEPPPPPGVVIAKVSLSDLPAKKSRER